MWKIKADRWRESARLYARSGAALLRASLFPAWELRKLEGLSAGRRGSSEEAVLRHTGRWFALLQRLGLRPSCLVCSLATARVLREEGHDAHVVFGVCNDNGGMEGHCWVAVDGRPVSEVPARFRELKRE